MDHIVGWLKIAMHRQPGHQQTSRAQPAPDKAMQPRKKHNSWWKDSGEETDKAKQPEQWVEWPGWIEWPGEEMEEPEAKRRCRNHPDALDQGEGQGPNGAPIAGEVGKWVDQGTYWLSCWPAQGGLPWVPSPPQPALPLPWDAAFNVAHLAFFKAHASRKRLTISEESAYAVLHLMTVRASLQTDKAYWARASRGEKASVFTILESMAKGPEGKSDYWARACQYEKVNILAILAKLTADKTDQQSSREFEGLTNTLNIILAIIREPA
jgi:hypothetical protein